MFPIENRLLNCGLKARLNNMERIREALLTVRKNIKERIEWQDIIRWAKMYHPNWACLATQTKRPEIRETYRNKIIRAYYDRCWY